MLLVPMPCVYILLLHSPTHRQSLVAASDGADAHSTAVGTGVVEREPLPHVRHRWVAPIAAHTLTGGVKDIPAPDTDVRAERDTLLKVTVTVTPHHSNRAH